MGRKGDVGRAAIVPSHADGWICGSDSIAIRCDSRQLVPDYLAAVLHVDLYRQQLQSNSTGALVASVNEGTLVALRLPDLTVQEQESAIERIAVIRDKRDSLVSRLERQIALLQEHRQALITAAVTGQFEIPGVAA